jgi:hypothetical protein
MKKIEIESSKIDYSKKKAQRIKGKLMIIQSKITTHKLAEFLPYFLILLSNERKYLMSACYNFKI